MYRFFSKSSLAFLVLNSCLYASNISVLEEIRKEIPLPTGVSLTTNRLGLDQDAIQIKNHSTSFEWKISSESALFELWIRPKEWNVSGGNVIQIKGENFDLTLSKRPDQAILDVQSNNQTIGEIPVDHWLTPDWLKQDDPRLWHHLGVVITKEEVSLFLDGFLMGKTKIAPLTQESLHVELYGQSLIQYGEIYFSETAFKNHDEFRSRFLNLYQNKPAIGRQLVSVPLLSQAPDIDQFLETGLLPGATVIPSLTALKDKKEKTAFPGSTLLKETVSISVARDQSALYLAFRTPYEGELGIKTGLRDNFKALGYQEAYEIFIEPPWTGVSEYVQLIGTAHGDQLDLKLMDRAWDGQWTWKTKILENEWRAVLVFNFENNEMLPPENGAVWGFNIFNTHANAAWSWSQRYHDTQAFGQLRFDDNSPALVFGNLEEKNKKLHLPFNLKTHRENSSVTLKLAAFQPGKPLPDEETIETIDVTRGQVVEGVLTIPSNPGTETLYLLEARNSEEITLYTQSFSLPTVSSLTRVMKVADTTSETAPSSQIEPEKTAEAWSAEELGETLLNSREWHNNTIGKKTNVPDLLEPVTIKDGIASLWNRNINYKNSLFARQITSNKKELLQSPIYLEVHSPEKKFRIEEAQTSEQARSEREVEIDATAQTEGIQVEVKSHISFDGLIWYELTLSPQENPVEINALYLQIPLKKNQAQLYNLTSSRSGHPPASDSGGIRQDAMKLDFLREILWIGTPREGLTWMAEDLRGWPIASEENIQSILPQSDGSTRLQIKLGEDFILKEKVHYQFALQATPLRPRPDNFRKIADRKSVRWSWNWGDGNYYPFFDNPEVAKEVITEQRKEGREVMPASSIYFFGKHRFGLEVKPFPKLERASLMHRENILYAPLWVAHEGAGAPYGLETPGILPMESQIQPQANSKNSPNWPVGQFRYNPASSFQDFYLWKLDQAVKETGLGAIYLDQPLIRAANRLSNTGYQNQQGTLIPTVPLRAMRNMMERIHNVFSDAHGKTLIKWHCSNQLAIPVFSYIDIYWDGENYGHSRSKVYEFYSKLLSPEKLQVQHSGLPFGFSASLLPEFEARYAPTPSSVRDMLGAFLIHDSHVWDAHSENLDIVRSVNQKWLEFPYENVKTFYYWDEEKPFSVDHEKIYTTLHVSDNKARVIIFNWSDQVSRATLKLDPSLGSLTGAKDVETDASVSSSENTIPVLLPPRDFRMIDFNLNH